MAGQEVHLAVSEVELVELAQTAELLGPAESLVAACTMGLAGRLTGLILLVFEDRSGLALVDLLMHQPVGTTTNWGELEQSAAKETTNIVGCAYVNALATHLPGIVSLLWTRRNGPRSAANWSPRLRHSCRSLPAACFSSPSWSKPSSSTRFS